MNSKDKKKLIVLIVFSVVGLPAAYFYNQSQTESLNQQYSNSNLTVNTTSTENSSSSANQEKSVAITPDEQEPKLINISTATDTLAAQIIAASPNQNETLINEAVKQSSRLLNSQLQNKNLQVQVAEADLAIAKSNYQKLEIEQKIKDMQQTGLEQIDQTLLPPALTNTPSRVEIPADILPESQSSAPEVPEEDIYEVFFVKGISSTDNGFTAICSFRGKSLVLRMGSVVNGKYTVTTLTDDSITLSNNGNNYTFEVNI